MNHAQTSMLSYAKITKG